MRFVAGMMALAFVVLNLSAAARCEAASAAGGAVPREELRSDALLRRHGGLLGRPAAAAARLRGGHACRWGEGDLGGPPLE